MLFCEGISLFQFRNYIERQFRFSENIIGITGKNGTGKTNLIDAIYYLSFTKSAFSKPDVQSTHVDGIGWRIEGNYKKFEKHHHLKCILRETNRKEILVDGNLIPKFSNHIGQYPAVCIAPDDISLVNEGGAERRRFLDTLLSQINTDYLRTLVIYQKLLDQRNKLLQEHLSLGNIDNTLLEVIDMQLSESGEKIFIERRRFLEIFFPLVAIAYQSISGSNEKLTFRYQSHQVDGQFANQLNQYRNRDLASGRTNRGPHKDDIVVESGSFLFKNIASQGQRKSLLFAFKIAEIQTLSNKNNFAPILLLDDIFEKLDAGRVENLLANLCNGNMQVFITDTESERLQKALKSIQQSFQMIGL